jgi:uncharacterized membrane protein
MSSHGDDESVDDPAGAAAETAPMTELFDRLEALEDLVDSPEERERVREAMASAVAVEADESDSQVFGQVVIGFDRADASEALLGALLFGIPMFVEGGTAEVGAFIATHPLYLLTTLVGAVAMAVGIIYVADIQDVRVYRPLLGFLPRRLVGVVGISFVTALLMMTAWGRVDWGDPWLALCSVSVAFVPMVIGAALGDLLPG